MRVTCFIRYKINPQKSALFMRYAERWEEIIPRCGGQLLGYFMPHEGTTNIAFGIIGFDSLADYEAYRARLKSDVAGRKNFQFAQQEAFILEEQRSFLTMVPVCGSTAVTTEVTE